MQISGAILLSSVMGASVVSGAAIRPRASGDRVTIGLTGEKTSTDIIEGPEPVKKRDVEERQVTGAVVAIAGIVGTAALEAITTAAVDAAVDLVKNISEWNSAREEFTKATVKGMMDNNPDTTNLVAAACYNMAYKLETPANVDSVASLDFKLGSLHTNYDCMYIKGPNTFYTQGDDGYANLAYNYFTDRCTFTKATGDLTCT
ncbi:uncharacterized protein PG998_005233 [Apiospora kogelbergensis]|uniref:uncharacterized protein n=1 Tax=Apiospora kogelbergensis TaxID=1337665 RepID=UPI003131BCA0